MIQEFIAILHLNRKVFFDIGTLILNFTIKFMAALNPKANLMSQTIVNPYLNFCPTHLSRSTMK